MKFIVLFFSSIYLFITLGFTVFSTPVYAANVAQSICQYIAADDKKRMRSFLKSNRLKIRKIFSGIQCNGLNLLAFAANQNASRTGKLIISKLPKSVISKQLSVLSDNAEMLAEANKRLK